MEITYNAIYFSMHHYIKYNGWLQSKEELLKYAEANNYMIDFDQYRYFRIELSSKNRINIHFILKPFKVKKIECKLVKGIIGIYINDSKKVKIGNYKDKKLHITLVHSNNPQESNILPLTDNYMVILYITQKEFKDNIKKRNILPIIPVYPMYNIKIKR